MRLRQPSSPPSRGHVSREALLAAAVLVAVAGAATAQRQFDELRKRALPADGDRTEAVALGDVDGDGDLDVVFGNFGQQNRLYLDDGDGIYRDATEARMPVDSDSARAVALGDVDADGDLDMVLGSGNWLQSRLYLNDGTGTYADATGRMPASSAFAVAVALGDVDRDGDLDIVVGGGQARLYLNDGTGTFGDATSSHMPVSVTLTADVALGDVDGDGDLDLVLGNYGPAASGGQNQLYLNDGTGSYTDATAQLLPAAADGTRGVALGDVDGDGDLDLVTGNAGYPRQNRLYLNDGTGSYTDVTATRLPVDSDGTLAVALGDADGDGDLDIVFGTYFGQRDRLYLNDGTGSFRDATATRMPAEFDQVTALALGDVDRDGDLDIVFASSRLQNRLFLNDGTGTYASATAIAMPSEIDETAALALGDVDGDRDLDVILGNIGQPNRLYVNDGRGSFMDASAQRLPTGAETTWATAVGDVDGDGDLDVVFGNDQQNRLYLNDGTGSFRDGTAARMPADSDTTTAVALGDVDGDGDLDMVLGNALLAPQNRLYLNDGNGSFRDATAAHMPIDGDWTRAVELGDVDGDGDLDLVVANDRQNRLYLNDGAGSFRDATSMTMPVDVDSTAGVALGDVDGDGDLDIVFGNDGGVAGSQNRLYLNDGTGSFRDVTAPRMPANLDVTEAVALGDVDGDGDLDMVLGNSFFAPQNRLCLNDGTGTYTDATTARLPADGDTTRAVALGDVDGDGDLDIVLGNDRQQNRSYFNLLQQLDAPFLLRAGRTYTLEAYARYGPPSLFDVALPMLSTATANIPVPPFGTLGLAPAQTVAAAPFVIPQPTGVGSITFAVPVAPALVGTSLYAQALLVPYPFPARLTNVTADVLIR